MSLRIASLILLVILINSCSKNTSSITKAQNFHVLDTVIDYSRVDDYPLFDSCNELEEYEAQKKCFETTFSKMLSDKLQAFDYKVNKRINDSSYVELLINTNGKTTVLSVNPPPSIAQNLPKLDSLIRTSVNELPPLNFPAKKRDIPVNSQYKLAVVVRTVPLKTDG